MASFDTAHFETLDTMGSHITFTQATDSDVEYLEI